MKARKCSGRFAYARNTFGMNPSFARDSSSTARTSSGSSSSGSVPKREGAALCAAPSLNGGWLLGRADVPAGDIDRSLLGRLVDVDRVRCLLQLRDRDPFDRGLGLAVVHRLERVGWLRVELVAGALVDVRRLVDVAARRAQLHDQPFGAVQQ